MRAALKGTIRGKTIELDEAPGFPDGEAVSVTVESSASPALPTNSAGRDALRRAAGAWAADADELDRYLEWNRRQRKGSRSEVTE